MNILPVESTSLDSNLFGTITAKFNMIELYLNLVSDGTDIILHNYVASAIYIRDLDITRGRFRFHFFIGADILYGSLFKPEGIESDRAIFEDQHQIVQTGNAWDVECL